MGDSELFVRISREIHFENEKLQCWINCLQQMERGSQQMKTNKSAISCCIKKVSSMSSVLLSQPLQHSIMSHRFGECCCQKGPKRFLQNASPCSSCCKAAIVLYSLPHTISVKPSSIFKHSLFRISFLCSSFFVKLWEGMKTRLATVSCIPVFLQERNEPLQSWADLLDKYIFRQLGTLNVYDLPEK